MGVAGFYVFNEAVANDAAERVGQEYVTVPEVQGNHKDTARRKIDEAGLSYGESKPMPSNKIQRDYVMLQRPEPGSVVRAGRRVFVTLSEGQDSVVVPDVRGKTEEQARAAIEGATLTLAPIVAHVPSAGAPGTVIGQDPIPGKKVARSSPVSLMLSETQTAAAAPGLFAPNLVGLKIEDARTRLTELGLKMVPVNSTDTNAEFGVVLKQNPEYGKEIPEGGTVVVDVRQEKEEPNTGYRIKLRYTVPKDAGTQNVRITTKDEFGEVRLAFEGKVPAQYSALVDLVYANTVTAEVFVDGTLVRRYVYDGNKPPSITDF